MKLVYDPRHNIAYLRLHEKTAQVETLHLSDEINVDMLRILLSNAPIEESDEDKPGVILDYDKDGNVVGLEILEASKRMGNPRSLEYAVTA
jgi:uncharacterized protein YuzE